MSKNGINYYIVERGHKDDPDPEQAGRIGVRKMGNYGKGVKTEHLPFNQTIKSGKFEFNRPPAPGTIMVGYEPRGAENTGYAHLIGNLTGIQEEGVSTPGNEALPFLSIAKNLETGMRLPPDIKSALEQNRTGIEKYVKQVTEKGEKFKQSFLNGIPDNGAVFSLAGIRNNPLENIATALDPARMSKSGLSSALSKMGIGSININSILSEATKAISNKKLSKSIENIARNSINDLGGSSPADGSITGNRVNVEQFSKVLAEKLKDVKSYGQLFQAIQDVQNPSVLADTFKNMTNSEIELDSLFGKIKTKINADGSIEEIADNAIEQVKKAFQSLIGSIPGASEANKFFKSEGTPLEELIDRFDSNEIAQKMKETMEKVSNNNQAKLKARVLGNTSGKGTTATEIYQQKQHVTRNNITIPFNPKAAIENNMS